MITLRTALIVLAAAAQTTSAWASEPPLAIRCDLTVHYVDFSMVQTQVDIPLTDLGDNRYEAITTVPLQDDHSAWLGFSYSPSPSNMAFPFLTGWFRLQRQEQGEIKIVGEEIRRSTEQDIMSDDLEDLQRRMKNWKAFAAVDAGIQDTQTTTQAVRAGFLTGPSAYRAGKIPKLVWMFQPFCGISTPLSSQKSDHPRLPSLLDSMLHGL